MTSIAQITAQTVQSTRQTEQAADELGNLARRLHEVVQQYQQERPIEPALR
jgi:hypothetical protein